jgi:uncharacterized protein
LSRLPRRNSDAEIEAFMTVCERLAGFDRRLSVEWIDGYLAALAAGPRAVPLTEWLPRMAEDAYSRAFADPEDRKHAEAALRARAAVLADQLDAEALLDDPDEPRLEPLIWTVADDAAAASAEADSESERFDEADEYASGAEWAAGFAAAIADFAADWTLADGDARDECRELLDVVGALRLPPHSDALAAHLARLYGDAAAPPSRTRLVDDACLAVQDLRAFWVDHAPRPVPRRVAAIPGRNDPCPCGSGKKYKRCHGAA